jgi:hypothetical protein
MQTRSIPPARATRRGVTTPLIAAALLLAALGLALVLDRLWLEAAQVELTTAGEAAALAAARALACDDRLKPDVEGSLLTNHALSAAVSIARRNTVASAPVNLDLAAEDVRCGRLTPNEETGEEQFVQTDSLPTHVRVTAHRSRSRGNPVALFLGTLSQQPQGDVVVDVEAGLDNRVAGVRPFPGGPVPALPLAIWQNDPSGRCVQTWRNAIEQRRGRDEYGYDPTTRQVTNGKDGIPEITLRSQPRSGTSDKVNLQLLDIGTGFDAELLATQFAHGWPAAALEAWGGELRLGSSGLEFASTPTLQSGERDALEALLGEPRICLLYSLCQADGRSAKFRTTCVEFVAVRVLAVRDLSDGSAEIVAQPSVITTRTALADASDAAAANPYIYRLTLTK